MVFLGDMFELGETAQQEHQDIVDYLSNTNIDEVYLIGSYFSNTIPQAKNCHKYKTFEALESDFKNTTPKASTILIKASRAMALERIVSLL